MSRLALAATLAAFASLAAPAAALAAWTWPVSGGVITAYRNGDNPYAGGQHRGIDISADVGERVVAAAGGLVRFAGTAGSSGSTVSVRTDDGRFDVSYLHLDTIAVRRGDRVPAGAPIGTVGTTGARSSPRPHLHFGVRHAGERHAYVDPLTVLPPRAVPPPRPPQAIPVAAPGPVRVTPAPAPAPSPTPAERAPHPAPGRVLVPEPAPGGAPEAAAHPAPSPASVRERLPAAQAGGGSAPARRQDAPARLGPVPNRGSAEARRSHAPGRSPATARAAGPDIGRLAACAGLLAAAAVLSAGGRRVASRRDPLLTMLLPALAGRAARTRE